jgi:hypothetical protein
MYPLKGNAMANIIKDGDAAPPLKKGRGHPKKEVKGPVAEEVEEGEGATATKKVDSARASRSKSKTAASTTAVESSKDNEDTKN